MDLDFLWWKHLGTNISDLKQKKLYNERTQEILNHSFKNHWKRKLKIPEVEKAEEPSGKKEGFGKININRKLLKGVYDF